MVGRPGDMGRSKKIIATMLGSAALFCAVPAAQAQTPVQTPASDAYSKPGGTIQTQFSTPPQAAPAAAVTTSPSTTPASPSTSTTHPAAATSPSNGSNLPFTGLDVGLIVLAGAVLLALGIGIRRVSRPSNVA